MSLIVATHSGPFHADDVVACALVRTFVDPGARVVRTRDPDRLSEADIVIDVGGIYDPGARRFDHHQQSYTGELSSAGMVLQWLADTGAISQDLRDHLQIEAFEYLDDVDNGRRAPVRGVPCLPRMVDAFNQLATTQSEFDEAFQQAATIAQAWLVAMRAEHQRIADAREEVRQAMDAAVESGSNVMELDHYVRWKPAYYELGGETHPTEYAIFPGTDGTYRIIGIPPKLGDFGQKRPLPIEWAGLSDQELVDVVGVPGAIFCHKNRFIAVFDSREHALQAMDKWDLLG